MGTNILNSLISAGYRDVDPYIRNNIDKKFWILGTRGEKVLLCVWPNPPKETKECEGLISLKDGKRFLRSIQCHRIWEGRYPNFKVIEVSGETYEEYDRRRCPHYDRGFCKHFEMSCEEFYRYFGGLGNPGKCDLDKGWVREAYAKKAKGYIWEDAYR